MAPKFDPELQWLEPYYLSVKNLLPRHRLDSVKVIPLRKGTIPRIYANISRGIYEYTARGKVIKTTLAYNYDIGLYFECWSTLTLRPLKRRRKRYSKLEILHNFAHELAHIFHYDSHTPHHKIQECRILIKFMNILEKDGYISEENEEKYRKKCGKLPKFD